MEQKDVMPRHNARILNAASKKNILDFGTSSGRYHLLLQLLETTTVLECKAQSQSEFVSLSASEQTECLVANMKYFRKTEENHTAVRYFCYGALLFIIRNVLRCFSVSGSNTLGNC